MIRLHSTSLAVRFYKTFRNPLLMIVVVMVIGSTGFWVVSDYKATILDAIYMTFITVATIGFGETIDLTHSPGGRIFLMVIATVGIATVTYATSKLTAFIVEGDLNEALRRRRMQDRIDRLTKHYIICGIGRVGTNVAHELHVTDRAFVAVEDAQPAIDAFVEKYPKALTLHGDSSDDEVLQRAGIGRAAGLFAVTGDDGKNLLITLSAKQLNPNLRVVARCHEVRNIEKLKRVGADAIVSPDFTGGMRIASSMVRPGVVNFLDEMLRSDNRLRVEEVRIPEGFARRPLGELSADSRDYILLAARMQDQWQFNPPPEFMLGPGVTLVVMVNPEGRGMLERLVGA
jgi:voltage-gated potassium channel